MSHQILMGLGGWETAALVVTVGATAETWEYDVEMGDSVATAYDVAESILAWANDGARTWSGPPTFSYEFEAIETYRLALTFTCSTSATWVPTAPLRTNLLWPTTTTGTSVTSSAAVLGSIGEVEGVTAYGSRDWYRQRGRVGSMGESGGWSGDVPPWTAQRPLFAAILDEGGRYAETLAAREAGNPRVASIYDATEATWRTVSVGRIRTDRIDPLNYRSVWEVAAE